MRLILRLFGEKIVVADPHIGLLHRGTEKLIENKTYTQSAPYFDRLDYVSMMSQEHTYVLAIEQLLKLSIPKRAMYIRMLFLEITRILNHLMAVTTHAFDVGAVTPFLWAFEEREKLMEFYERVSGARMHAFFICPGGIKFDIPIGLIDDIYQFIIQFDCRLIEITELLNENRIWKQRLKNIGCVTKQMAYDYGFSGVMLRSTGIAWDLRVSNPYEDYKHLLFKIPVGVRGDCYDRYIIRMAEMRESCLLIKQCLDILSNGPIKYNATVKSVYSSNRFQNTQMEVLINHFLHYTQDIKILKNDIYIATESPKGEFGVFISSNDTSYPYRVKVRSPGYYHLQGLNSLSKFHSIADLVAIIGSLDIVFGEIDR